MTMDQLTLWNDPERGLPNILARSALFNVDHNRTGPRAFLEKVSIFGAGPIQLHYSGYELRQDDLDVWLQLVHMARDDLAKPVEFTCYAMFKELQWSDRSDNRVRLDDTISRLQMNQLRITLARDDHDAIWSEPLVMRFACLNEKGGGYLRTWRVELNPKLATLYQRQSYTRLDWATRLALSPIAKRLHAYYHSHREPLPVGLDFLHKICGSKCKDPKEWRKQVRSALAELVQSAVLKGYEIHGGLVSVTR